MAVTSEPPWLNFNSGIAARNGTASHVIPFGFTSTSGSFLTVLLFGGVTHTNASWTERLSPVNSGELSVFTKTSAGESSFTDTINASNYPVNWAVFEFPAGTAWTNGTSNSVADVNDQTWPALGSLPGAEQVVFAARGQAQSNSGGSTIAAGWSAPWVEDYDQVTVFATTDGCWMNVAHAINRTGTSITPTSTYSSSNATNNIQQVVFALDVAVVAAAASPVFPRRPSRGLVMR
jgi:hypothetical protein